MPTKLGAYKPIACLPLLMISILFILFNIQKGFSMTLRSTLIPRKTLFGNPDKTQVRISPDGKYLTYVAPYNNVLNLWLQSLEPDAGPAIPLTHDTGRGIQKYSWCYDNRHILYIQDKDGDENWRLFKVDITTKKITTLTDEKNVQVRILAMSHKYPDIALIGLNNRDPQYHDVYRLNIQTEQKEKIYENKEFLSFLLDDDLNIRLACKVKEDGGMDWFILKGTEWELYRSFNHMDQATSNPLGFSKDRTEIYWLDSQNRDLAFLTLSNVGTQKTKIIAKPKKTDFSDATFHPTENKPLWVEEDYLKPENHFLEPSYKEDFEYLKKTAKGDPTLVNATLNFKKWIIAYMMDAAPVQYYLYDRDSKTTRYLFSNNKKLENLKLCPMIPLELKSRDGLSLVSYLTLPQGVSVKSKKQLPTVLLVHGGPEARDSWGYNSQHQWLANRGYAVLSVNYRGSDGFGKKFISAGNHEWGRKMHDDLIDAVNWLIQNQISDSARVAIMGGSYGGYATLIGLTMTPEIFACGVDIVGPSNLITLLNSIPPYWKPVLSRLSKKIGDPKTTEGQALLKERSPLTYVDQIQKPLLIAQGANDPRVKQAESDQIVDAMKKKNISVTYLLYPDEGHGFVKPANRISFYAVAEKFLADHLGGVFEPSGDDFEGASIQIKEGVAP